MRIISETVSVRSQDEAARAREPAAIGDQIEEQESGPAPEVPGISGSEDERVPEEAGYGYGV